jgi:ribosomal protein L7/L12
MSLFGTSKVDELEARVDRLSRQMELIAQHLGIDLSALSGDVEQRILVLVEQGKKIDAIRLYRAETRATLAEAKHAVEEMAKRARA